MAARARWWWWWPAACALIGALALALWLAGAAWPDFANWTARELVWRADDSLRARPWTLWTASLVHLSFMHLAANLLALAALALLGCAWRLSRAAALAALALGWPLSTALLLLWPEVTVYRGLSGLNHALALICWAFGAIDGIAKSWTFALFAGIALKLLGEQAWSRPVAFDADWGFAVVHAAHLAGAIAGAASGLPLAVADRLLLRWRARR